MFQSEPFFHKIIALLPSQYIEGDINEKFHRCEMNMQKNRWSVARLLYCENVARDSDLFYIFLTSRALYLFRGRLFSLRRCGSELAPQFSGILFAYVERPL